MHFFISISKLRRLLLLHFTSPEIGMLRNGISKIAEVPAEHWKKKKKGRQSGNTIQRVSECWRLPRGISSWPWRGRTGSRSSGGSSRRSFRRSASPGGSLARKWRRSFAAPRAKTRRSCAACSCTVELRPLADWDPPLLKRHGEGTHVNTSCQPRHICEEGYCEIPTSGFFTMDEWLSQHVPGWLVQLLHIHLPPLGFQVSHDLFHSSQAFHCLWQLLNTMKSWRENGRQLWLRDTLWNDKTDGKEMLLVFSCEGNR